MTLAAPTFPIPEDEALQHLLDALGANYAGKADDTTLTRALGVDALTVDAALHPRPWATAARLIRDNTEYELDKGLRARLDRKLDGLEGKQAQMDALAGIAHLLPGAQESSWPPVSGAVDTRVVWQMPVDARPFRTLTTPSGGTIRCAAPALNPLALGVSGKPGGVAQDNATHTIDVYVALGTPPADLADNVAVTVDVVKGQPQTFRVLRNGIDRQAGSWKLYVRAEGSSSGYEP